MVARAEKRKDTQGKETGLSERDARWVRLHVSNGLPFEEIARRSKVAGSTVSRALKTDAARAFAAQLIEEHARTIRGMVASMAAEAVTVARELLKGQDTPAHVRGKIALQIVEWIAYPPDGGEATLNVNLLPNPQAEFQAWQSSLPRKLAERAGLLDSAPKRKNGNGNGSSSSAG